MYIAGLSESNQRQLMNNTESNQQTKPFFPGKQEQLIIINNN